MRHISDPVGHVKQAAFFDERLGVTWLDGWPLAVKVRWRERWVKLILDYGKDAS
jgi:hypothetical protein